METKNVELNAVDNTEEIEVEGYNTCYTVSHECLHDCAGDTILFSWSD